MTDCLDGDLLTADEVAAKLRIKADTLMGWVRQNRVPCIRLGRKIVRFNFGDVVAALKAAQGTVSVKVPQ